MYIHKQFETCLLGWLPPPCNNNNSNNSNNNNTSISKDHANASIDLQYAHHCNPCTQSGPLQHEPLLECWWVFHGMAKN